MIGQEIILFLQFLLIDLFALCLFVLGPCLLDLFASSRCPFALGLAWPLRWWWRLALGSKARRAAGTHDLAALAATAMATVAVPAAKAGTSNMPMGPFQRIVLAFAASSA